MHYASPVFIQGRSIGQWLDPRTMSSAKGLTFLRALGNKMPWIIDGDVARSKFIRELMGGGGGGGGWCVFRTRNQFGQAMD